MTATSQSNQLFNAPFTADEILSALPGAQVSGELSGDQITISTDTRSLKPGQIYIAFIGEIHDGHRFLVNASQAGAKAVIVSQDWQPEDPAHAPVVIKVADTLKAYHRLTALWLEKVKPVVVGVTGSSGKTTTKEMCAAVFSKARRIHKSQANENNEFGVAKTVLSMPQDCQVLILEMAMRGAGQIAQLASLANPDVGIITTCGTAHIELLGSRENIIKAKCELFEHLKGSGTAIIGAPTDQLQQRSGEVFKGIVIAFDSAKVTVVDVTYDTTVFTIDGVDEKFAMHAHGQYHLQDAWCAVMAGIKSGLTAKEAAQGLASYQPVEGRGQRLSSPTGATIVDESYNANPESIRCAVEKILDRRAFPEKRKIIVLGEMAELGNDAIALHEDVGNWLSSQEIDLLITIGERAHHIARGAAGAGYKILQCPDQDAALEVLAEYQDKDNCIVVKGSHCTNLDQLVAKLVS